MADLEGIRAALAALHAAKRGLDDAVDPFIEQGLLLTEQRALQVAHALGRFREAEAAYDDALLQAGLNPPYRPLGRIRTESQEQVAART